MLKNVGSCYLQLTNNACTLYANMINFGGYWACNTLNMSEVHSLDTLETTSSLITNQSPKGEKSSVMLRQAAGPTPIMLNMDDFTCTANCCRRFHEQFYYSNFYILTIAVL